MGANLGCCCSDEEHVDDRAKPHFGDAEISQHDEGDVFVASLPALTHPTDDEKERASNSIAFASTDIDEKENAIDPCPGEIASDEENEGVSNPSDFASIQFRTDPGPERTRFSGVSCSFLEKHFASDPGHFVMFVVGRKGSARPSERRGSKDSVETRFDDDSIDLEEFQCDRQMTTVAAGHEDSLLKDWRKMEDAMCENPNFVLKVYDELEAKAYKEMCATNDLLMRFTPEFIGEVEPEAIEPSETRRFLRLSNLLYSFQRRPHVMDCKLGCRSFSEKEVANTKLRPDLFKKMVALDASEPTAEEHARQAITKHRWMTFNDKLTNLVNNKYRIDGVSFSYGSRSVPKAELVKNKTLADNAACIVQYFLPISVNEAEDGQKKLRCRVAEVILDQLRSLRDCIVNSSFAARHSFVGSSALFVVDAHGPHATVSLIDFAKTTCAPESVSIDHMSSWELGNHEDGLLIGIDSLVTTWQHVLDMLAE